MLNQIHPQAIIGKNVTIGKGNIISPLVIIEDDVVIEDNNIFDSSCHIKKNTKIGNQNKFHSFSVIGDDPQDISFQDRLTSVSIKDNNNFREGVTVHRASKGDETIIGSNCYLMANSHIAHDCILSDNIIIANNSLLAGHVIVAENVFISGNCAIHQFVRIGENVMIGGIAKVVDDIPPYMLVEGGSIATYRSVNYIGLSRKGVATKEINLIKNYYKDFYQLKGNTEEKISFLKKEDRYQNNSFIEKINLFIQQDRKRNLIKSL